MVLDCDILMQKFSRRPRPLSRLIRNHESSLFSGRRGSPLQDDGEGAPQSPIDRNENVDGFVLLYFTARILQAGPAEGWNNILGYPGCHLG